MDTGIVESTAPERQAALAWEIVHADQGSLFGVNSVILYGPTEAIIVDAQFERRNAEKVAARAKALGRRVTAVYISHNDPDFYFGAEVLQREFPEARILATPQTVQIIERTHGSKLDVWGPQLGDQAPAQIVTPVAVTGPTLTVDGHEVIIAGFDDGVDPDHTFLWVPEIAAIVGGISLAADTHLWLADSPRRFARDLWRARLTQMKALAPRAVVPAHSSDEVRTDPGVIDFVAGYLDGFEAELASATTTDDLVAAVRGAYPDLSGEASLEMSARVLRGEQQWAGTASYPATGRTLVADFGDMAFELAFGLSEMTFTAVAGPVGSTETQKYGYQSVGPQLFVVHWQEPASGARVVHVQDFRSGTVTTHIADGASTAFRHLTGTLTVKH